MNCYKFNFSFRHSECEDVQERYRKISLVIDKRAVAERVPTYFDLAFIPTDSSDYVDMSNYMDLLQWLAKDQQDDLNNVSPIVMRFFIGCIMSGVLVSKVKEEYVASEREVHIEGLFDLAYMMEGADGIGATYCTVER